MPNERAYFIWLTSAHHNMQSQNTKRKDHDLCMSLLHVAQKACCRHCTWLDANSVHVHSPAVQSLKEALSEDRPVPLHMQASVRITACGGPCMPAKCSKDVLKYRSLCKTDKSRCVAPGGWRWSKIERT